MPPVFDRAYPRFAETKPEDWCGQWEINDEEKQRKIAEKQQTLYAGRKAKATGID